MQPLRVAMTLEQLWHRVPGGTAIATLGMARALAAQGDVAVVGVGAAHVGAPPEPFVSPVQVKSLPLPRPALYWAWHSLRRPKVQLATGDVDVIHATTLAIPPRSALLVVTIHDLAFLDRPADFTARGMRLFTRGLELALQDAVVVLVPSEATRRDCIAAGFEDARLRVVPWGVDAAVVDVAHIGSTLRRYGISGRYVLWTGTREPRKNLSALLDAFERVDTDARLVLAGPEGWGTDELSKRRDPRVVGLGFVPPNDLVALYAGAAAFCYPSLKEGFGLPVLEAMAQATPTITSRGTSTEEIGGDAVLLVDPHDPSSIADAIQQVLDDEGLAGQLRAAGSQRAATFTWKRTAELVSTAYREAARMHE
ncbi:MAG TPA: glycosyltransferase family 1 protein [Actinomycetota bacterium]|nr:glycosyltransferase family 1 protein [Actinomycetota bacterium]